MACRFMNADGNGSREQAIKCMEWCLTKDAHVLSNSWGEVPDSQSLQVLLRGSRRLHVEKCCNSYIMFNNDISISHHPH